MDTPRIGWICLDIDGAVNSIGAVTCGGIIRDDKGNQIKEFFKYLGYQPSTTAELLGILEGLQFCWNARFNKINIYSNSAEALSLIQHNFFENHSLSGIINKGRKLIMNNWIITSEHTFREANRCADMLAHQASQENLDRIIYVLFIIICSQDADPLWNLTCLILFNFYMGFPCPCIPKKKKKSNSIVVIRSNYGF